MTGHRRQLAKRSPALSQAEQNHHKGAKETTCSTSCKTSTQDVHKTSCSPEARHCGAVLEAPAVKLMRLVPVHSRLERVAERCRRHWTHMPAKAARPREPTRRHWRQAEGAAWQQHGSSNMCSTSGGCDGCMHVYACALVCCPAGVLRAIQPGIKAVHLHVCVSKSSLLHVYTLSAWYRPHMLILEQTTAMAQALQSPLLRPAD
jgi:hypothetical protein